MTADEFREARTKLGWSIHRTAREIGRHPSMICRYQAGEIAIPPIVKTLMTMKLEQV